MRSVSNALLLFSLVSFALMGCSRTSSNPNFLNTVEPAKIKGMDPAQAEDLYSGTEITRVYEPLLQYHPFKRPYVLEPLLASEMPSVSKDGLTYTFKIRPNVHFHDDKCFPGGKGRVMTAKDVEFSLKRLADPHSQSTGWWILENRVAGLNEWHEKYLQAGAGPTNYNDVVDGLRALDDNTLQIKLKAPYPQLLYALAMPYTSVLPKEAIDTYKDEIINHEVGTGPFVMTAYNPNDSITYKKNPNYWDAVYPSEGAPGDKEKGLLEDAGKKLPLVDGVNVRIIIEEQPRWLHFLKGDFDTAGIPKDYFNTAVAKKDPSKDLTYDNLQLSPDLQKKGILLDTSVLIDLTYTAFNTDSKDIPQFADKRVRQAISLAMDDREALNLFYNNMATFAQTPIPPGVNGYDPSFKNPYRTNDIEKARKLLADAGYPGGKGFPVIPMDILASSTERQHADYTARNLARLGLKVEIVSETWPQMLERVQRRQAQLWGIAWSADYPDAENFLQLFYGPNAQPGGMNGSYYKNPAFDTLFEKARILLDTPERTEMYKKLGQMVAEDTPVVLGLHRIAVTLDQPWIRNYKYDDFHLNRAKYLRIDLETKKKFGK